MKKVSIISMYILSCIIAEGGLVCTTLTIFLGSISGISSNYRRL